MYLCGTRRQVGSVINELGRLLALVDRGILQAGWLALALMALSILGTLIREAARRLTYGQLLEKARTNTMLVDFRRTGGCLVLVYLPEASAPGPAVTVADRPEQSSHG